jgi:unsaturated chondroitin disaccharide hydrolase
MAYRETGRAEFLATARELADYFLARLPADRVPFWDFNDPAVPNTWRDSSAAAITASGLLELSELLRADGNSAAADGYRAQASGILASLASDNYLAEGTANDGILLHGALNVPANSGRDSALIFGDYYFLEAINRYGATAG